jgi:heat shock protein HslJ
LKVDYQKDNKMKTFQIQMKPYFVCYLFFLFLLISFFLNSCSSKSLKNTTTERVKIESESSYFYAQGTSPVAWSLEISELLLSLRSDDGLIEMVFPHVEPVRAMDANVKYYVPEMAGGGFRIDIVQNNCHELEGENRVTYEVKITIIDNNGLETIFLGCGEYRVDYRLHDVWVLEQMQGREVTPEMFLSELPMIEIRAKEKDFSGFGGCNKIIGKLFQERELLRFFDISNSKMMCDTKNKENFFLTLLQSGTGYELKNSRLYISNPNGILLVLKKID